MLELNLLCHRMKELQKYKNPVLVMAAQMDCLFRQGGTMQGEKVWLQGRCYLLRNRGHINELTEKEKQLIIKELRSK